jgi:hypothetical protein
MDSQEAFAAFLLKPSTLPDLQGGQKALARPEMQWFIGKMNQMTSAQEKNAAMDWLASLLPQSDSFYASMAALFCGILVERNGDLSHALDGVMELLIQQLSSVREYIRSGEQLELEERFQRYPAATRAQAGLQFTIMAAMTMLCRSKEARKVWRRRDGLLALLEELEDAREVPFFLRRALTVLDDKELLVLDKRNQRGFMAHLEGVQDVMYHCFALLQHAILEHTGPGYLDAEPTNALAVRLAQNKNLTEQDYAQAQGLIDTLHFDFCYISGIFLPGSASFNEIPRFAETPILFIAKCGTTLSPRVQWKPINMYPILHENLQSRIEIQELTPEEMKKWETVLEIARI